MKSRNRDRLRRRIKITEEELDALQDDWEAASRRVDRLRLGRDIKGLEKDLDCLYEELDREDYSNSNPNIRELHLEKTFQKIDFDNAKNIAKKIKDEFEKDGGCSLIFMQKCKKQMGHECLREMIEIIMRDQMIGDEIIGDYQSREINLGSSISSLDKKEFLIRIAEKVGAECLSEEEDLVSAISTKICSSLGLGTTVFIKVSGLDDLLEKDEFLSWLMSKFWKPLVEAARENVKENHSKLILALMAESQILDEYSADCFCDEQDLEPCKIKNIPLSDWTVIDIYNWLTRFRSLLPQANLSNPREIQMLAQRIHRDSEGTPESVCLSLRERFL